MGGIEIDETARVQTARVQTVQTVQTEDSANEIVCEGSGTGTEAKKNSNSKQTLPSSFHNLFAAGECTGGIHGGDRLAGVAAGAGVPRD